MKMNKELALSILDTAGSVVTLIFIAMFATIAITTFLNNAILVMSMGGGS